MVSTWLHVGAPGARRAPSQRLPEGLTALGWGAGGGLGFQKSFPGESHAVKVKHRQRASQTCLSQGHRFLGVHKAGWGAAFENGSGCDAGRQRNWGDRCCGEEEKLVGFRKTGADQLEQATPQGEGGH